MVSTIFKHADIKEETYRVTRSASLVSRWFTWMDEDSDDDHNNDCDGNNIFIVAGDYDDERLQLQ